jgi:hypothetical protein
VFLTNATGRIYQLKIVNITDNIVTVGIPGGLPGQYIVVVNVEGLGYSTSEGGANQFTYVVSVNSISPNSGSINGGTLITITG